MNLEIETVNSQTVWNDLLESAPLATPYHRYEFLETCVDHSECRLYPYVAISEGAPIGTFPVFERRKGPLAAAFSPPPDLKIPYLGPVLTGRPPSNTENPAILEKSLFDSIREQVEAEIGPQYTNIRTVPVYNTSYKMWTNNSLSSPRYTYAVDLSRSEEEILTSFSKDARRNARIDDSRYEIKDGDKSAIKRTLRMVRERHAEQDIEFPLSESFVIDLFNRLPNQTLQVKSLRNGDAFLGGEITVETEDVVYGWLAAGKHDCELPVNDLLTWHVLRDGKRRGRSWYDLVGANNPRLSKYKAKFGPELAMYTQIREQSLVGTIASNAYQWVN